MLSNNVFETKRSSLKEKVNVIKYAKVNKCIQLELAKKVSDVPSSNFKIAKKNHNDWKCNKNLNQKRKCSGKESEIKDALLERFSEKRSCNDPLSGNEMNNMKRKAIFLDN